MKHIRTFTRKDRATFEGREVSKITPITDGKTKEISHYLLSVADDEEGTVVRKIRPDEVSYLIEAEILVIDRGYYSIPRQADRALYGDTTPGGSSKKQREKVALKVFLGRRMGHYHELGMVLTPDGVKGYVVSLAAEYAKHQCREKYGTDKPNSTQHLRPLPSVTTLLDYYRQYRKAKGNVQKLGRKAPVSKDQGDQCCNDKALVLSMLMDYATQECPSAEEVAANAMTAVRKINAHRRECGFDHFIREYKCTRTYERWIKKYLPPFDVLMQREGLAAARAACKTNERGMVTTIPGECVIYDAWKFHVATLDVTRDEWLFMTEEQRAAVKRVRRWVIVALDAATRVVLGFAICSAPNEQSALEAMRSCYGDKTHLLRAAGNFKDSWNYCVRHQMTVSDSGTEFGANPFGGSRFVEACRVLACSLMNTTAGVSELRGQIERIFLTFDLRFARKIPGWTTGSTSTLGDRKPATHACLTDDDLLDSFVGYIADYHTTPHRGLDGKSPATAWKEMSETPEFDDETPGPAALRLACGFYVDVNISDNGICFAGNSYSNRFIRDQRMAPMAERIDGKDKKIQAMVDPFDLGGITVFDHGEPISIPCIDDNMRGKSLRAWNAERELTRSEARADSDHMAERRQYASGVWKDVVARAARAADVGMSGYTKKEVERAALEIGFGKGHHEKPFIGRAEYMDPLSCGISARRQTEIQDSPDEDETDVPSIVDAPNSMDRLRAAVKRKSRRKNKK